MVATIIERGPLLVPTVPVRLRHSASGRRGFIKHFKSGDDFKSDKIESLISFHHRWTTNSPMLWPMDMVPGFAWGTYFWKYTSRMMRGMFEKIEEFREFKQANPESKKGHKYTIPGFMLLLKIWILETFPEATKFYIRTLTELPQMRVWRSKSPLN
ncbi:unnamed protein product [Lactuca saligna]|uniref:Uncharacterized protein n=1 Tax=Lactuca saligna TaxID=75948 RepID=A0AA36E0V0_LACSI|nr:unnamed protein product [Lactuca saligna]